MSQINTNAILDASGGTTATVNGFAPTVSNMAGRNRIINGDMRIDQRNAGASVTPSTSAASYAVDRFSFSVSQNSKCTTQQNAGSVTPPSGFKNYWGCTVGASANVTVGAGDYFGFQHRVEGNNLSDMGFGAVGAATFTISFWVRSSVTGTFGFALQNGGQTRSYATTYTINSANTWEQKTITIAGDTSGTWATDNTAGLICTWGLGIGSTYAIAAGSSWTTTSSPAGFGVTGTVQLIQTNSATFYITGVQLEAGSVATPFEHRQYGQEEMLCKRYYQKYVGGSGAYGYIGITMGVGNGTALSSQFPFEQEMRATPSTSYDLTGMGVWDGASLRAITAISTEYKNTKGMRIDIVVGGGGLTTGHSYSTYGSTSTVVQLNAEL